MFTSRFSFARSILLYWTKRYTLFVSKWRSYFYLFKLSMCQLFPQRNWDWYQSKTDSDSDQWTFNKIDLTLWFWLSLKIGWRSARITARVVFSKYRDIEIDVAWPEVINSSFYRIVIMDFEIDFHEPSVAPIDSGNLGVIKINVCDLISASNTDQVHFHGCASVIPAPMACRAIRTRVFESSRYIDRNNITC